VPWAIEFSLAGTLDVKITLKYGWVMTPDQYFLSKGSHTSPDDGRCAMEWVAHLAGEPHSDAPACVSPVLKTYGIALNDRWDDEQRQKLRPYLARCIGTAGDGRDVERAWMATDWLVREFCPAFLELVPSLASQAAKIRALPPLLGVAEANHAMGLVNVARKDAAAAWDAAWDAARDAAWDAAWDAARDAAWDAARDAARAAARDAAWDAARAAARAAAWDAARDAAWDAARAAARAAAWDAAWDAVESTVTRLQVSALDLFDRMLPTELIEIPVVGLDEAALVCGVRLVAR
jgi:hypothetical protein